MHFSVVSHPVEGLDLPGTVVHDVDLFIVDAKHSDVGKVLFVVQLHGWKLRLTGVLVLLHLPILIDLQVTLILMVAFVLRSYKLLLAAEHARRGS